MAENKTSCSKFGVGLKCPCCADENCIRNGKTTNDKQQYKCKSCSKRFVLQYSYQAYNSFINSQIVTLTKEGLGIRSTARVLHISPTTVLRRIVAISQSIRQPPVPLHKSYEVDEIRTFLKTKSQQIWIVYALEKVSRRVVGFAVGSRSNRTLSRVLDTLHLAQARSIFTDGLKNYRYLIAKTVHRVKQFGTNIIERNNLTLRTHLKRLSRRTICFSRSAAILFAVLKIYFWS